MAQFLRSYGISKLYQVPEVFFPNTVFLPTIATKIQAVNDAEFINRRFKYEARLFPPTTINPVANLFPLPTVKTDLYAVNRAIQSSQRQPKSTRLRPPAVTNSKPSIFLPTVTARLNAMNTNQIVNRRFKYNVRLFPATILKTAPSLFLPTLGGHLVAVKTSTDLHKFRGKSVYSGINYSLLRKPPFLPTLGTHLNAVLRSRDRDKYLQGSAKLYQVPYLLLSHTLFLPTLETKLQAVNTDEIIARRFKYEAKLYQVPGVFFPNKPAFLPTLGHYSYAIQRALLASRLRPISTKLRSPTKVNSIPNLFLPTRGTHLQAVELNRFIVQRISLKNSTKLRPPVVIGAYVVSQGGFVPNYVLPENTLWEQNADYLQDSAGYNIADLYNVALPYNISPSANLPSVYQPENTQWALQPSPNSIAWNPNIDYLQDSALYNTTDLYNIDLLYNVSPAANLPSVYIPQNDQWALQASPTTIAWNGNSEYLQGAQFYNPSLPYNDALPYNAASENLVSVATPNDTIWSGGSL